MWSLTFFFQFIWNSWGCLFPLLTSCGIVDSVLMRALAFLSVSHSTNVTHQCCLLMTRLGVTISLQCSLLCHESRQRMRSHCVRNKASSTWLSRLLLRRNLFPSRLEQNWFTWKWNVTDSNGWPLILVKTSSFHISRQNLTCGSGVTRLIATTTVCYQLKNFKINAILKHKNWFCNNYCTYIVVFIHEASIPS